MKHILIAFCVIFLTKFSSACPVGTFQWQNNCYYISYNRLKWAEAEAFCASGDGGGGHLASIENAVESNFLTDKLSEMDTSNTADDTWIGGNNQADGINWQWSDGKPFSFTSWKPGFPNNASIYQCIGVDQSTGQWGNDDCHRAKRFMCKFSQTTSQCPACPNGYALRQGFCYKVFPVSINWINADSACVQEGGHLASIHSMVENDYIQELVLAAPPFQGTATCTDDQWLWIGLWDPQQNNRFVWTDGTDSGFRNWEAGQPVIGGCGGGVQCTEFVYRDGGQWRVKPCGERHAYYVCKKPAQ